MEQAIRSGARDYFEASLADFKTQATRLGWSFWRGVAVGFVAAFPLAYIAVSGEAFLGLGI